MDFDPDSLREGLRPLVPGEPVILTPEEDAYLRHYGIHFSEDVPALAHHFGAVESDEHRLAAHLWMPAEPRGTAVVIHGYYDHTGLYGHLIRHLIDRGLAVVSFDLPGHGLSTGAQATIDTFDHYVDAFEATMRALEHHIPQPWFLLGQSTGGAVAMEWLLGRGVTRDDNPFEQHHPLEGPDTIWSTNLRRSAPRSSRPWRASSVSEPVRRAQNSTRALMVAGIARSASSTGWE